MTDTVIQLKETELTAYSIMESLIIADKASKTIGEYRGNAAKMVYKLAIACWDSKPDLEPLELLSVFNVEFQNAVQAHQINGNLSKDYETQKIGKAIMAAFNKVRSALELSLDIRELESCNGCEKAVTAHNDKVKADAIKAKTLEAAEKLAKKKGITVDQAKAKLEKAGMTSVESIKDGATTTPANDSVANKGLDPSKMSTILQDDKYKALNDDTLNTMQTAIDKWLEVVLSGEEGCQDKALGALKGFSNQVEAMHKKYCGKIVQESNLLRAS